MWVWKKHQNIISWH